MPKKQMTDFELIVYQLSEMKGLMADLIKKFDTYKDNTDIRLRVLEKFQISQEALDTTTPKVDIQKIILAAFSLVSTIVAIALGIRQHQ